MSAIQLASPVETRAALSEPGIAVHTDIRWPAGTGIYNVMNAYIERVPPSMRIVPLRVRGKVAHPLSPVRLTRALKTHPARNAVFWNPGFVPPVVQDRPSVVTVHDLTHRHFYSRAHRIYYDAVLKRLYRRCAAVVCVSDFTRNEFLDWSGMDRSRVHVIHNAVDSRYTLHGDTLRFPFPYVLYPGNRREYKNVRRLIDAFGKSDLPRQGIRLMLTGKADPDLSALAKTYGFGHLLHFAGVLPDEAMPRLYRGALFLAFISSYEGFGLPILEAMATGVPVLTSAVSSMPEVAGDAAVFVDPSNQAEVSLAMSRLASNEALRQQLIERGLERICHFDWNRSAKTFWQLVDHVGSRG